MMLIKGDGFMARTLSPKLDRLIRIWYSTREKV